MKQQVKLSTYSIILSAVALIVLLVALFFFSKECGYYHNQRHFDHMDGVGAVLYAIVH